MTIERQVLEKLRDLPPEKQKEVLDFVEFLKEKNGAKKPLRSLPGLWKDLDIHITEEDIAEARREIWSNFPPGPALMSAVLDTQTAICYLLDSDKLSALTCSPDRRPAASGAPTYVWGVLSLRSCT